MCRWLSCISIQLLGKAFSCNFDGFFDSSIQKWVAIWRSCGYNVWEIIPWFEHTTICLNVYKKELKESNLWEICGVMNHLTLWKQNLGYLVDWICQDRKFGKTLWQTLYVNASNLTTTTKKHFMSLWCILRYKHRKWPALSCCGYRVWEIISLLAEMLYQRKLKDVHLQQNCGIIDRLTMWEEHTKWNLGCHCRLSVLEWKNC